MDITSTAKQGLQLLPNDVRPKRAMIALVLLALAIAPGSIGEVTRGALEDAYIAVAVFVAATLALFYGAERVFGFNISQTFREAKLAQVPLAALLGALPGCGGAVVVVAAYASGSVSMGAVVATLTATMGDAAFLLIAKRPDAALVLLPISFVVGILSGYVVDLFDKTKLKRTQTESAVPLISETPFRKKAYWTYAIIAAPGLILGILGLAQVEFDGGLAQVVKILAMAGVAISMMIWVASPVKTMTNPDNSPLARVAEETSFILAWVIGAFLLFEYLVAFAGIDLQHWFNAAGFWLPMIAILIGFLPGCGPQILVTTFYLNGLIPFSALIGNAIANDGDALFPAIAIEPKAAFWATIYSAVPAFIVAYAFYFFWPTVL